MPRGQASLQNMAAPLRVGVLTNPTSGGNRKKRAEIVELLTEYPEVVHHVTESRADLESVLFDFARREVNLLVVNGGDGTVQALLTEICRGKAYSTPPPLALLRSGTASMLARDVGLPGKPREALRYLLHHPDTLCIVERPVLEVRSSGNPLLYGMFFGAGEICRGIELCRSRFHSGAPRGELLPGIILARLLLSFLLKEGRELPGLELRVGVADQGSEKKKVLLVLVTALERLFLGLRPWWGMEKAPLHYTLVESGPPRLVRTLPRLLRGRLSRTPLAKEYVSRNIHGLQLEFEGHFTLDGELFSVAPPGGTVSICSAGPVAFLSSAGAGA